jgi:serine/threonine protein kinase
VIKSVHDHPRVQNERDVLRRFQHRTPRLRPLIDEVEEPFVPATIALRHLDNNLWDESVAKTLNRKELKYVSRCILEALEVLYEDGYVHTGMTTRVLFFGAELMQYEDVKPDNVFVNLQKGDMRFADVQLGDLGGCYHVDSEWATSGTMVGAPIWSSPEIMFEMAWNTATDIWSFGAVVCTSSSPPYHAATRSHSVR